MNTVFCVSAVGVDFVNKKFLIVREKQGDDVYINVPSGKVEFGENPEQAAFRELFEETSCTPHNQMCFAGHTSLTINDTQYLTAIYGFEREEGMPSFATISDPDVESAEWLTYTQIKELSDIHRNGLVLRKLVMALEAISNAKVNKYHIPWYSSISV